MSMSMPIKRSGSEIDLYEEKPDITSDSGSDTYFPTKTNKKPKSASKSVSKSMTMSAKTQMSKSEDKSVVRKWTEEEDRIFLQLMGNLVKTKMWEAVKEDGRLGYRGSQGIKAHAVAFLNKLKKA